MEDAQEDEDNKEEAKEDEQMDGEKETEREEKQREDEEGEKKEGEEKEGEGEENDGEEKPKAPEFKLNAKRVDQIPWVQGYLCAVIAGIASCVEGSQDTLRRVIAYAQAGKIDTRLDFAFLSTAIGYLNATDADYEGLQKVCDGRGGGEGERLQALLPGVYCKVN